MTCAKTQTLIDDLKSQQAYLAIRELPDGSVAAVCKLMFTWAIVLGCNEWGYDHRFCFDDPVLVLERFGELLSEDDEPQGYIARR